MTSDVNKVASVVGGKTARACDSCIRNRALWYCAADDAFLCQSCDSSVHSANPLARRHERVRLKYASFKSPADDGLMETRSANRVPSWNKRKSRTPRGNKQQSSITSPITSDEVVINSFYHVPEALSDETRSSFDGQLVYGRVPIFDSFAGESCTNCQHSAYDEGNEMSIGNQNNASFGENDMKGYFCNDLDQFITSDMDLEEFAADVLGNESFGIDGLGLMGCDMMVEGSMSCGRRSVKEEVIEIIAAEHQFQYDNEEAAAAEIILNDCDVKKRKILLRLDYDGILSAWPDGSSPWTSGTRPPDVDHSNNECWPTCMATCQQIESHQLQRHLAGDSGREARVSRYREKRRTRLFSKKIRYEVRKLNAEKRPRMKGRFVKRSSSSSFLASSTVSLHVHGEE